MIHKLPVFLLLILWAGAAHAQQVEGVVTDNNGDPVIGATAVVKGTKIFAVTDIDGRFTFPAPKELPFSVRISSTGFKPRDIQVFELTGEVFEITLSDDNVLSEIVVTARRRTETLQEVPIPVSVLGGELIEDAGAFNVNRVKELVPTVQLYSSNPRNTTLNIRGLGHCPVTNAVLQYLQENPTEFLQFQYKV